MEMNNSAMTPNMFAWMEVTCIKGNKMCETKLFKFVTENERKRAFRSIIANLTKDPSYGPLVQYPDNNYILYRGSVDDANCITFTMSPFENYRGAIQFIKDYFDED